jgi:hypothetical protein
MTAASAALLQQAIQLPADERIALVDGLLASLDATNPALDALWLREAEYRLDAYRAGQLGAVDADETLDELGAPK